MPEIPKRPRCFGDSSLVYANYHDHEWGIPVFDDTKLFEMLVLEGAQAGLSWETVLKKRSGYREVFNHFSIEKVASMDDVELDALTQNPAIIRNRLKIYAARTNARAAIAIQKEHGSLSDYLWSFVDHALRKNHFTSASEVPTETLESQALSKALKKRGMRFVGPTIIYAFMQAVGMVDDHLTTCWRYDNPA